MAALPCCVSFCLQQRESVIHLQISPFLLISFPFRSPQSIEQVLVSYLFCKQYVDMPITISQLIPLPHLLLSIYLSSMSVSQSLLCTWVL